MHDIHIHTQLSSCAKPDATFTAYCQGAKDRNLSVLGFTDHLWDHAVAGWNNWYAPQDLEHVMSLKEEIKLNSPDDIKIYFGCETEYVGNGTVGLHQDNSELFDFVLVPPHHFHIPMVRDPQITALDKLTELFIRRFMEVCEIDFAFGIAHPFVPLGLQGREAEVLQALPEKLLRECFTAACESGKSIELNTACIKSMRDKGVLELYKNILIIARECGCKFHIGSDAHTMSDFAQEIYDLTLDLTRQCRIELEMNPLKKYVLNK